VRFIKAFTEKIYMLKQKFIAAAAIAAALVVGMRANTFAFDGKGKKQATFMVRIENISDKDGLVAQDGSKYPFAVSPGMYVVTDNNTGFFKEGKTASAELEAQAEDGNPELLAKKLLTVVGGLYMGIFNTPVGADMPAPILPGGAFEFTFKASVGMKLNFLAMYGQSNDLFYAPAKAISLFDAKGNPISGDFTSLFQLWDAGTEVNQAPGIGPDQAPRQMAKNTGAAENGVLHLVKDGFSYPETQNVLRITITAN